MHAVAIVGAGRIGAIHARNAAANARLRLAYVVDPIADAATRLARACGAQSAGLEDALSDPEVKGVIVASSTDTHLEVALKAIEAGKSVFCEKPIDLSLEKVQRNAPVFSSGNFFLGFNRRFDPNFAELWRKLRGGEIGRLETLHIISHDPAPPPLSYIGASGGLFRDMTIHDFDMARWLAGEEVAEVYAAGGCLVDEKIADHGDIDTAKIILKTASGRLVFISNTRRSGYGYDQRIEAYGAKGRLAAGNMRETTVEHWSTEGCVSDAPMDFFLERYAAAYVNEMEHFADMLSGDASPTVTYDDGLQAQKISESALRSARNNRPVKV
ncbi:inositol 2-dehydrogenase [Hyphococcus sp.]|uniref:inositol 2-dehydrogenase n=1 Tax=Hyphococcus sp. TaxID=2038636 RepID=UPI0035C66DAF